MSRRDPRQPPNRLYIGGMASLALAAAAPAQARSPFILFFDSGSAQPRDADVAILDSAAAAYLIMDARQIVVTGFTDRAGSTAANDRLGLRRAEAVRAALIARGVAAGMIAVESFGETRPLVETPDGVAERQNRFVTITMFNLCRTDTFSSEPRWSGCD